MPNTSQDDLEIAKKNAVKKLLQMASEVLENGGVYGRTEIYSDRFIDLVGHSTITSSIYYFLITGPEKDLTLVRTITPNIAVLDDSHIEALKARDGFLGQILRAGDIAGFKAALDRASISDKKPNNSANIAFNKMKAWIVQRARGELGPVFDPNNTMGNNDPANFWKNDAPAGGPA